MPMPRATHLHDARMAVLRTATTMATNGLVTGSSGNVSQRFEDRFLITPSGIPYDLLELEQIVEIDADGRRLSGRGDPSSEWRMHVAIHNERPDVAAIVHTHSVHATAVSLSLAELPILHDEGLILFGTRIPISDHHAPGTWELARAAALALGKGRGMLIARHGVVGVGRTPGEALMVAIKIEEAAHLFLHARQLELSLVRPPVTS